MDLIYCICKGKCLIQYKIIFLTWKTKQQNIDDDNSGDDEYIVPVFQ